MGTILKTIVISVISLTLLNEVLAQREGYVVYGDTLYRYGVVTYDENKPCDISFDAVSGFSKKYNCSQVTEFGFNDGLTYFSRTIPGKEMSQNRFIRSIEYGGVSLFMVEKKLYLENDSMILLTKDNYQEILLAFTDRCKKWKEQIGRLKFNTTSLRGFIRKYNEGSCDDIGFFNFGIMALTGQSVLDISSNSSNLDFSFTEGLDPLPSNDFGLGFFLELPVHDINNFSLETSLRWLKNNYATNTGPSELIEVEWNYIIANFSPRFHLTNWRFRPYVQAGPSVKYTLSETSKIYNDGNEYDLNMPATSLGLEGELGMRFFYMSNRYITIGLNHARFIGESKTKSWNTAITMKLNTW